MHKMLHQYGTACLFEQKYNHRSRVKSQEWAANCKPTDAIFNMQVLSIMIESTFSLARVQCPLNIIVKTLCMSGRENPRKFQKITSAKMMRWFSPWAYRFDIFICADYPWIVNNKYTAIDVTWTIDLYSILLVRRLRNWGSLSIRLLVMSLFFDRTIPLFQSDIMVFFSLQSMHSISLHQRKLAGTLVSWPSSSWRKHPIALY